MQDLFLFQTIAFNLRSQKTVLDEDSGVHWTNIASQPEFLVGEQVSSILYY